MLVQLSSEVTAGRCLTGTKCAVGPNPVSSSNEKTPASPDSFAHGGISGSGTGETGGRDVRRVRRRRRHARGPGRGRESSSADGSPDPAAKVLAPSRRRLLQQLFCSCLAARCSSAAVRRSSPPRNSVYKQPFRFFRPSTAGSATADSRSLGSLFVYERVPPRSDGYASVCIRSCV